LRIVYIILGISNKVKSKNNIKEFGPGSVNEEALGLKLGLIRLRPASADLQQVLRRDKLGLFGFVLFEPEGGFIFIFLYNI